MLTFLKYYKNNLLSALKYSLMFNVFSPGTIAIFLKRDVCVHELFIKSYIVIIFIFEYNL